jgi:hypothetical protein
MKTFTLAALILASTILIAGNAEAQTCKSKDKNLCFSISGSKMKRISASPAFQRALKSMAAKIPNKQVVIYQGYRTPEEQRAIVRRLCGPGKTRCPGAASPKNSRHVISTAADPMIRGNVIKPLCYAANQARVEHLGPRSAAAVYGYGNKYTWGHIDDSTGSNYTPRNCKRSEGLNRNLASGNGGNVRDNDEDTGYQKSRKVRNWEKNRRSERNG